MSFGNFFEEVKEEFNYEEKKQEFIDNLDMLKSMSVEEQTLYKKWQEFNKNPDFQKYAYKFDLFDTLVDNMTWVRISVDAGTEKTYNWIRRPGRGQDWNKMHKNLAKLIETNNAAGKKIDIGVGMVITPDTYKEIVDYANTFKDFDLDYANSSQKL